jgi:signal transduction histidine kinase
MDRIASAADEDAGLAETSRVLDQLALIAEEITAGVDAEDVFRAVQRHVEALLRSSTFYIGLVDQDGGAIDLAFVLEEGHRRPPVTVALDDPRRPAAVAVREGREVLFDCASVADLPLPPISGMSPTLSGITRPLVARGRTLGVMSVQNRRPGVYGERERLVFRSLCSHVAVALGNVESYRRLADVETLATLGEILQDVTASLEFEDIFAAIERHVGMLLDTTTLYIGLLDERREWIDIPLFVDGGRRRGSRRFHIDDPDRPASRCVRENREIYKEETLEEAIRNDIPGTVPTCSSLFRPLSVHGRVFGVLSVQTQRQHAYRERERLIFRAICSHAAVALSNAENYRRLAAIETLQTLGEIGHDITASLDLGDVMRAIERHVGTLFEASTFWIGILQADGTLSVPLHMAGGRRQPGWTAPVADADDPASRAIREQKECQLDGDPAAGRPAKLIRPLSIGERVLGVMVLEAPGPSIADRDVLVFRTLAASVASAVANADAYAEAQSARAEATVALGDLRNAQQSLIQAEKMASLGQLVAGVAHEVNTPVGMALTVATSLASRAQAFRQRLDLDRVRRSDLADFVEVVTEAARQMDINLHRASDLVHRFKEVAADRASDQHRPFDLAELIEAILASLAPELRRSGHRLDDSAPAGLVLDSHPGAVGQILVNLIMNALQHAFRDGRRGTITLRAEPLPGGRVEILVADDGAGMDEADRLRIFEPFFTTRRGSGGTGLGLHIAFNLATQTLRGALTCRSAPGLGTEFRLTIPVNVASAAA